MKPGKIILTALLCFMLLATGVASGLVIQEVIVCTDFDMNGRPIPNDQVPVTDDAVFVWVNMTDIMVNDTLLIEWWPPSGDMYHEETWTAPAWIETTPHYSRFFEIEIMSEPAENMPGEWSCNIYNNDTWWGHAVFELVDESTPSGPSTPEDVPSNVMAITDVQTPSTYNPGENVTVSVTVGYNFDQATDIAPSVWNNKTQMFVATVDDTVNGMGTKTYDLEFVADEQGTDYYMLAYYIDGQDIVYTPDVGIVPFRLEDTEVDTGVEIPSLDDLNLPVDIDFDEIQNQIGDYINQLRNIEIEIPEELEGVEEEVKRLTGIPGYPVEALILGAAALIYAVRRRY
jgi:hypothetical protein